MEVASIGRVRGRVIHDFVSSSVAVPQPSQAAQASRPSGRPTRSSHLAAQALKKSSHPTDSEGGKDVGGKFDGGCKHRTGSWTG